MLGERHPAGLSALLDDNAVDAHRNLSCADYDRCLDEALRQRWRSWTCSCCPAFGAQRSPRLVASAPARAA